MIPIAVAVPLLISLIVNLFLLFWLRGMELEQRIQAEQLEILDDRNRELRAAFGTPRFATSQAAHESLRYWP